jgi:hypothetical protein
MPKKHVWLVIILMLASAVAGALASSGFTLITRVEAQRTASAGKAPARKYEYQTYIAPGPQDLVDQANKLADDGWELTNVITDERIVTRYIGFFRRVK